jgi:hypothetical protein
VEYDKRILSLALEALHTERQKIDLEIAKIEEQLGSRPRNRRARATAKTNRISSAGRKAIAAAQKKRWAALRAKKAR